MESYMKRAKYEKRKVDTLENGKRQKVEKIATNENGKQTRAGCVISVLQAV